MESHTKIMRIISGALKGKKISYTNLKNTRPLRDYVRENIFNIISHGKKIKFDLNKKIILDLYSGVGSFGIECLSRNVDKVIFVEKDPSALAILRKNINNFKLTSKVNIISNSAEDYIKNLNGDEKFDLIFLDPPYKDNSYLDIINLIKEKKIYKKYNKVIIHREKQNNDGLDNIFKIDLEKNYGRSKIIFGSF